MKLSRAIAIAFLVTLVSAACGLARPTTSPATQPSFDLLAHGTDELFWIARIDPIEGDATHRRTIVQFRNHADQHWRYLGKIDARAISLANRGNDLIVLLDSGEWMLMWPGGGTLGQPLPYDARMLAIAGDDRGSLWAIGEGRIGPITPESATATKPVDATQPAAASLAPLTIGTAIFHWDTRQWRPRALIDKVDFENLSMTIVDSKPVIARGASRSELRVSRFLPTDAAPKFEELGEAAPSRAFKLLSAGQRAVLWFNAGNVAGAIAPIDRVLASPIPLIPPAEYTTSMPTAVTAATGQLRLVFERDGKVFEQAYSVTGKPSGGVNPLPMAQTTNPENLTEWVGLGVLLLLTVFVFGPARRRVAPETAGRGFSRDSSPGDAHELLLSPRLRIAPLLPRAQAALFDALPLLLVLFFLSFKLPLAQSEDSMEIISPYDLLAAGAMTLYFLHTLISELLAGRTIGKWLFGLSVVTAAGERPRALAIVVRNVVRVLEVLLFLPIFVPFFTAEHQRIGDMAANTVVVSDEGVKENDE